MAGDPQAGRVDRVLEPVGRGDLATRALVVGALVGGVIVAVRGQRTVLYDDAAIFFRYAERIAAGDGWTYNDGDHTNGASSPLYTMVLALAVKLGADVETAARAIGGAGYAAAIGLVAYLGARVGGLLCGALAGGFLLLSVDFHIEAMSGMESALAAAIGLAVLVAVVGERETLAGVLLGIALVTKLDAAALAAAIGVVYLVARRRPPWRIGVIAGAVLTPWLVYSTVVFGSPLPYSLTQKAGGSLDNPASKADPMWMFRLLTYDRMIAPAVVALGSFAVAWRLTKARPVLAISLGAAALWGATVLAFYSLFHLGDAYSWYLTSLYPPIALGAAATLAAATSFLLRRVRVGFVAPVLLGVAVGVCVVLQLTSYRGTTLGAVVGGHVPDEFEAFEGTRRDAGRYLGEHAAPGDVVRTCFGWIAFGAPQALIAEDCPLNTRDEVWDPDWIVSISFPGTAPPDLAGMAPQKPVIVATFQSSLGNGGRTDVIEVEPAMRQRTADRLCELRVACRALAEGVPTAPPAPPPGDAGLVELLAWSLEAPAETGAPRTGGDVVPPTRTDASCLAQAYVEAVGAHAVAERGVTVESLRSGQFAGRPLARFAPLTRIEAAALVDRWLRCGELASFLEGEIDAIGVKDPVRACLLRSVVDSQEFRDLLVGFVRGEIPPAITEDEFTSWLASCPPG